MKAGDYLLNLGLKIQSVFPRFVLSGGTAIMLQFGHRKSIDLNFFFDDNLLFERILKKAQNNFPVERFDRNPGTVYRPNQKLQRPSSI